MPAAQDANRRAGRGRLVAVVAGGLVPVAAVALAVVLLAERDDAVLEEIDRALAQPVESAHVKLEGELRVSGSAALPTPLRLRLAGPYRSGGSRTVPAGDLNVLLTGSGRNLSLRLISTAENAFVAFQGVAYEVGATAVADLNARIASAPPGPRPGTLEALGVEPRRWLVEPDDEGEETLRGVETEHYSARVDAGRLLDDLQRAAARAAPQVGRRPPPALTGGQRQALGRVFAGVTLDAYVGEQDRRIRQLVLRAPFAVPPQSRARAGGATGGLLYLSLALDRIGEPVRVAAPRDARPIEDLRRQVGPLAPPGL